MTKVPIMSLLFQIIFYRIVSDVLYIIYFYLIKKFTYWTVDHFFRSSLFPNQPLKSSQHYVLWIAIKTLRLYQIQLNLNMLLKKCLSLIWPLKEIDALS